MANYIIFSSESSNGIILAKSETEVKTDIETKVEPDKKKVLRRFLTGKMGDNRDNPMR